MEWNKIDKVPLKLNEVVMLWQENRKADDTYEEKGWVEVGFLQSKKETAQGFSYEFRDIHYQELHNITHWRPLPKGPQQDD